jgi:hypothetical protein
MSTEAERQRWIATVGSALNHQTLDTFDPGRIQRIVSASLGDAARLTVDEGGGLHEESGVRVGAIRRAPSGEWIVDGQNVDAARSDAAIPGGATEDDVDTQR